MRPSLWFAPLAMLAAAPANADQLVNVYDDFNIAAPGYSNSGLLGYFFYPTGNSTVQTIYNTPTTCNGGQATCATSAGIPALGTYRANDANPNLTNGSQFYEPNYVNLHPGPGGQQPIVTFTAPGTDTYTFNGEFKKHDTGNTYHVIYGDANRGSVITQNYNNEQFGFSRAMNPGDQIVFLLDATDGYTSDSTGFALSVFDTSVAAVPEPATWLTMILGFGAAGGTLRRRRRQGASAGVGHAA